MKKIEYDDDDDDDDDDEKVRKVQDHCRFAGRYRGATPKIEIPLV